jgi:NAD(P)-dependent dehydrogenase (short-subunit alcohol dehydrogenase family)
MGTIAIVGMGPLLGLGIARRFGREGYKIAMISRKQATLDAFAEQLSNEGIEAAGFAADVSVPAQIEKAFAAIRARFGEIDVLEFSPTQWNKGGYEATNALSTTVESAKHDIDLLVLGAIACARQVIPNLVERKTGALFFTTGYSAIQPIPIITSLCLANSALRAYAYCLDEELAPSNIYVGTVSINAFIADGTAADPLTIADLYWDMYTKRDRTEAVFGPV